MKKGLINAPKTGGLVRLPSFPPIFFFTYEAIL